jgi:hypothetical protein
MGPLYLHKCVWRSRGWEAAIRQRYPRFRHIFFGEIRHASG